ncbi:HNH endonuclease signature motif containing protein [Glycomyces xiaoerkulensis]|uniref:HNH endonuclease signature motif containing protein n=1 Tax=Glycomyces xiaoerkulensis TaxID=2038139 RepID=UPI000C26B5A8|nr:HNH endonuclease signature motif containing protein [Glycomyces xiaoerkulensis]
MAGGDDRERSERAHATRARLTEAAAAVNAFHARALAAVIDAQTGRLHREADGFSGLRDWLQAKFDFHARVAADLAAVARCAKKFPALAEAAVSGAARIDPVAATVRRLERTRALRVYAKTPYRTPEPSPFDPEAHCATPEELIGQYCRHAPERLTAHLEELEAALDDGEALLDGLAEQSLQRLDLVELEGGMWAVSGMLASETGAMFAKLLTTAAPPPRQDQADEDGLLPAAANDRAEALHHMLAVYGTDPAAATRHGHTTLLHLTADLDTLRGVDTGRVPTLEGRPVSLESARRAACQAIVVPSVFDYGTGESLEQGRPVRVPGAALRRKLELEQPGGCAWHGCTRPVHWCEAHHIVHFVDGGPTEASNLILLCRFHHGRVHTPGWSVAKTGPGQALIVHHDPACTAGDVTACGCADHRTDTDLEAGFAHDVQNLFPTGLYPQEWSERYREELDGWAEQISLEADLAAARAARRRARARYRSETGPQATGGPEPTPPAPTEPEPTGSAPPETAPPAITPPPAAAVTVAAPPPDIKGELHSKHDPIPFLAGPPRATAAGRSEPIQASPNRKRPVGHLPMPTRTHYLLSRNRPRSPPQPGHHGHTPTRSGPGHEHPPHRPPTSSSPP